MGIDILMERRNDKSVNKQFPQGIIVAAFRNCRFQPGGNVYGVVMSRLQIYIKQ